MKTLIVIPARYASSRFPGKPLHRIAGQTLLSRVVDIAKAACQESPDCQYVVATDNIEIEAHAKMIGAPVVMTDPNLPSGTDRALAAANITQPDSDFIVNLQGDAPFTPPSYLDTIIRAGAASSHDLVTPVIQLSWDALDNVRANKTITPFSGTTCIVTEAGDALWFSKRIIPQIRGEAALRANSDLSPVLRHVGLYGYRRAALERFVQLPQGYYEVLEGLEQLRFLENGMKVRAIKVPAAPNAMWGIDTLEDAQHAEALIAKSETPNG
ncbi:MAG: manno-octulosonate cytidylyltransferase [Pseudomonadota bacterium]